MVRATASLTFPDRSKGPRGVAFSPDGRLLAGNDSGDRAVRLWKVPHGGAKASHSD